MKRSRSPEDESKHETAKKHRPSSEAPHGKTPNVPYPFGTIKRTWAFGYDRQGDDIKIEEVLQRRSLKVAVLSSWQVDWEWIFGKVDLPRTKLVFVWHSKDGSEDAESSTNAAARLCIPLLPKSYGVMHSKLMLLFHEDYLRVVVPSANLVPYDWGEMGGFMENSVFLVDLPRLPDDQQGQKNTTLTPFADELLYFLRAQDIDKTARNDSQKVLPAILNFDFSRTSHIAFVHTILGNHDGEEARSTGLQQLAKAVKTLGVSSKADRDLYMEYAVSSLGMPDVDRLETLYYAFRGDNPSKRIEMQAATRVLTHAGKFRILFPTASYVKGSKGGSDKAGTIFCSRSIAAKFPRTVLRRSESRREGCLSHSKFVVAEAPEHAFVYIGSHNLSAAAWGDMSLAKKKGGTLKLVCKNWECGVIMVTRKGSKDAASNTDSGNHQTQKEDEDDIFKNLQVCIPFKQPPREYTSTDEPWTSAEF